MSKDIRPRPLLLAHSFGFALRHRGMRRETVTETINPMTATGVYSHSPKIIVIAGAPAAGKSTVAARLRDELDYSLIRLDEINTQVASTLGIQIDDLRTNHPKIFKEFVAAFLLRVRSLRFSNIVLEGCRISHPHIYDAFKNALYSAYGEYVLLKNFYLCPEQEKREKQYLLRQAQLASKVAKSKDPGALKQLKQESAKGFCAFLEPPLPDFEVVEDASVIFDYAVAHAKAKHPALCPEHEDLLKAIAESGAFNPFYQRVEVDGKVLVSGFTESEKSWLNIKKLNLDFRGKSVLDIGCMLGYFSFKLEEAGAQPFGVDIDEGAIVAAKAIAAARKSAAIFSVSNSEKPFGRSYDIVVALNVLHRVSDFGTVCANIFGATKTAVLEVGEGQLKDLLAICLPLGFQMKKMIQSHRVSDVIGQRVIACLTRT